MFEDDSRDTGPDLDAPPAAQTIPRPAAVPPKFWDPARGALRTEALLRAYLDLERRLSSQGQTARDDTDDPDSTRPARPEDYRIVTRAPALTVDPEVNRRLHQAGFTNRQVQLVYDLAHERLAPLLAKAEGIEEDQEALVEQLRQYFGGETRWRQLAPQLSAWGRKSLPAEAFQVLASSVEGVKALYRLMASGEPSLGRGAPSQDNDRSEADLKAMIQDPRYWKNRDPAFIAKVSDGFRRLYGEG